VDSLTAADAMGWSFDGPTVWVSGHPGLNRSTDGGRTFGGSAGLPDTDVHAFGGSGPQRYGASPAVVGMFTSSGGGATWEVRTRDAGPAFFGRILVDPGEVGHLVPADARAGPVENADGGRTWRRLGGVSAAARVAWGGPDPARLVAPGPRGATPTSDGYAAALSGGASLWTSAGGGRTWVP